MPRIYWNVIKGPEKILEFEPIFGAILRYVYIYDTP